MILVFRLLLFIIFSSPSLDASEFKVIKAYSARDTLGRLHFFRADTLKDNLMADTLPNDLMLYAAFNSQDPTLVALVYLRFTAERYKGSHVGSFILTHVRNYKKNSNLEELLQLDLTPYLEPLYQKHYQEFRSHSLTHLVSFGMDTCFELNYCNPIRTPLFSNT